MHRRWVGWSGAAVATALWLGGCSWSQEDPRVTFCKRLTESARAGWHSIEWQATDTTLRRPETAEITLTFDLVDQGGVRKRTTSACQYAYEALDDTALNLANPLDAYETLPFAMRLEGRAVPDAELLRLVNAEQRRQRRAVIGALGRGAGEPAARAGTAIVR